MDTYFKDSNKNEHSKQNTQVTIPTPAHMVTPFTGGKCPQH